MADGWKMAGFLAALGSVFALGRLQVDLQEAERLRCRAFDEDDGQALDEAITRFEVALADRWFAAMPTRQRVGVHNVLAQAYDQRFRSEESEGDIRRAIALWEDARRWSVEISNRAFEASFNNNLAFAFAALFQVTGDLQYLERAFALAERAVSLTDPASPDHYRHQQTLALRYLERFDVDGRVADLELAVALLEEALPRAMTAVDRAKLSHNLSRAFAKLHIREGQIDHAVRAREMAALALSETSDHEQGYAESLNTHALRLSALAMATEDVALLNKAIEQFRDVLVRTSPSAPVHGMADHNLASALSDRYHLTGDASDLDTAIEAMRALVRRTDETSPHLPSRLADLGRRHEERYVARADRSDRQDAVDAYEQACRLGAGLAPEAVLQAARAWGDLLLLTGAWADADVAYGYAVAAVDALWRSQIRPAHGQSWLARAAGLHARAAFAAAHIDDLPRAVALLEHGRAFALSDRLELWHRDLDRLPAVGRAELYERFLAVRNRLLEHAAKIQPVEVQQIGLPRVLNRGVSDEALRTLRSELDEVVAAITAVEGFEGFLQAPTFEGAVLPAAAADPTSDIMYLATSHRGGLAVTVAPDGAMVVTWLDDLTEDALETVYDGFARAHRYRNESPAQMDEWDTTLDEITAWLGRVVLAPLTTNGQLTQAERGLVVVPQGLLGMLPLHAAWIAAGPNGERSHLMDLVAEFRYAPNARALRPPDRPPSDAIIAGHRRDDGLRFSAAEAAAVVAASPDRAQVATDIERATVLDHLTAGCVLHLAIHGYNNPARPLDSYLLLADGQLTLGELLTLPVRLSASVAILSACETGVPNIELPDEVISLATGLIHAGLAGVVSSLWAIPDSSTLLLMSRTYELYAVGECSLGQSLRAAQAWMRQAGSDELAAALEAIGDRLPAEFREQYRDHCRDVRWVDWRSERPCASVRHWGAFALTGTADPLRAGDGPAALTGAT